MTKRMLTAVLTVALTLSLTACGEGQQQEMGETRTVYTMDTVMNLTANHFFITEKYIFIFIIL